MKKKSNRPLINGCLLAFALVAYGPMVVCAQLPEPLTEQERELATQLNGVFRRAVEQVMPAVVFLDVSKKVANGSGWEMPTPFNMPHQEQQQRGLGSGVIIDARGYVITNDHVVKDTDTVMIQLSDGRVFTAEEVMLDPDTDLAVVRFDPGDEELPVARFGDSEQLQVGDMVIAMGSPFGLDQTATAGIVSFLGRQTRILNVTWGLEDFIQTDAAINRGNSGGPLVNLYGEVIGINSNILSPTGASAGYGFAVPSRLAQFVADELIQNKEVRRGYLGVSITTLGQLRHIPPEKLVQNLGEELADFLDNIPIDLEGVLIRKVEPGTPAAEAGIHNLDIVTAIDEKPMTTSKELQSYIAMLPPNTTVQCEIWRDDQKMRMLIDLGDRNVAKEESRKKHRQLAGGESRQQPWEPSFPPAVPDRPGQPGQPGQSDQSKPKLGISVKQLKPELAQRYGYDARTQGVMIDKVIRNTLAEQSGLQVGDIIVSVEGIPVKSVHQLKQIIGEADLVNTGIVVELGNTTGTRTVVIKSQPD